MKLDATLFPLVVMRWNGPISDEELEQLIRQCDALAARSVAADLCYVCVSVGDGDMTATQRKRVASWMNGQANLRDHRDLGTHLVLRGVIARGALTAIMWLTPSLSKVFVHADEAAAMAAARASLEQANGKRA